MTGGRWRAQSVRCPETLAVVGLADRQPQPVEVAALDILQALGMHPVSWFCRRREIALTASRGCASWAGFSGCAGPFELQQLQVGKAAQFPAGSSHTTGSARDFRDRRSRGSRPSSGTSAPSASGTHARRLTHRSPNDQVARGAVPTTARTCCCDAASSSPSGLVSSDPTEASGYVRL